MPKAKHKSVSRDRSNSDNEAEPTQVTQTQTMSQAAKATSDLPKEQIQRIINNLVKYLLIADQKKFPIKRQDINKNVLKENSRGFPLFMSEAKKKLNMVFGVDLVEIEGKGKQQKTYILVSTVPNALDDAPVRWSPEDNSKMGLVTVILSIIFMSGNVINDSKLYHALKRMGVDIEQNHETFGDVKKLITTEFVRQGYLEYSRQPASDPPSYEFKWGRRAEAETAKRSVLDFVCNVYGEEKPENWASQWRDVLRSEGSSRSTSPDDEN